MKQRICPACLRPLEQRKDERPFDFKKRRYCDTECSKVAIVSERRHNWLTNNKAPATELPLAHVLTPQEEYNKLMAEHDAIRMGIVKDMGRVLPASEAARLIVTGGITYIKDVRDCHLAEAWD